MITNDNANKSGHQRHQHGCKKKKQCCQHINTVSEVPQYWLISKLAMTFSNNSPKCPKWKSLCVWTWGKTRRPRADLLDYGRAALPSGLFATWVACQAERAGKKNTLRGNQQELVEPVWRQKESDCAWLWQRRMPGSFIVVVFSYLFSEWTVTAGFSNKWK